MLFDGVCNFCNASVNFLIDRDPDAKFRFGALQSEEGLTALREHDLPTDYFDSIVLLEDGQVYVASDAVLRIAHHMPALWPAMGVFWIIPRPVRDAVYNWIARNRYRWFGKRDTCRLPTPEYRARFL